MSAIREQFESRYPVPAGVLWSEETSRYALVEIKTARHTGSTIAGYEAYFHSWGVWKSSRDALAIELPDHYGYDDPGEAIHAINDCRAAIEAVGLRVSP
ncbi:hypothetical protein K5D32_02605 [Pseudomonas cichorii]|uniref:hypothetical protein n=1 Tax=Pseudomonas cichorii TaxID=36746 RepID=UPI001C8A447C|nr:hypothetical protein [Pseudomonas cichorii]MBX8528534.1 hypothetical protein [Pseudomonas cichorii]